MWQTYLILPSKVVNLFHKKMPIMSVFNKVVVVELEVEVATPTAVS